jgi:polyisoprenoid-binding protein YceI
MTTTTTPQLAEAAPGLVAGTWKIDPAHSHVGFSVRHLMVSKVRGAFTRFDGSITIDEALTGSRVEATIEVASVDTRDAARDAHLRTSDFFAVDEFPVMTFRSTGLRRSGGDWLVAGDLTLRGVTRPVELTVEFEGVQRDPWGGTRAGFIASTTIHRKDFGVDWNAPVDGGGVVVGDKVTIDLEIEAVLEADPQAGPSAS